MYSNSKSNSSNINSSSKPTADDSYIFHISKAPAVVKFDEVCISYQSLLQKILYITGLIILYESLNFTEKLLLLNATPSIGFEPSL
jgi:hypothetical protein